MISIGEKPFRGEQLFSYFHRNMGLSMDDIHILPMKLRQELKESAKVNRVRLLKRLDSKIDNTKEAYFVGR